MSIGIMCYFNIFLRHSKFMFLKDTDFLWLSKDALKNGYLITLDINYLIFFMIAFSIRILFCIITVLHVLSSCILVWYVCFVVWTVVASAVAFVIWQVFFVLVLVLRLLFQLKFVLLLCFYFVSGSFSLIVGIFINTLGEFIRMVYGGEKMCWRKWYL